MANTGLKHELSAMEAMSLVVSYTADLCFLISYPKMFGWNLSNCLGL